VSLTSLPISGNRGNYMNSLNNGNITDQITIDTKLVRDAKSKVERLHVVRLRFPLVVAPFCFCNTKSTFCRDPEYYSSLRKPVPFDA